MLKEEVQLAISSKRKLILPRRKKRKNMSCWIHWLKTTLYRSSLAPFLATTLALQLQCSLRSLLPPAPQPQRQRRATHWGGGILGIPVLPDAFWYLDSQTNNHLWAGTTSRLSTVVGQQLFPNRSIYFISDVRSLPLYDGSRVRFQCLATRRPVMFSEEH